MRFQVKVMATQLVQRTAQKIVPVVMMKSPSNSLIKEEITDRMISVGRPADIQPQTPKQRHDVSQQVTTMHLLFH